MPDEPDTDLDLGTQGADYLALIRSARVSERLRVELLARAQPDDPAYEARTLSARQLATLRALLGRVIPQDGDRAIDLGARLDTMMAESTGNGWRYEVLPTDPDAYRLGLDTLDALAAGAHGGQTFTQLSGAEQDDLLEAVAADCAPGDAGNVEARLNPPQMRLWFEEVRSDAVRLYVSHPRTMARIGYSGIANGGAGGAAFTGFNRIGTDEREAWEPAGSVEQGA